MAAEPLTNEAIALTEKKVDMALDDIIKMSKNNGNKGKKQRRQPNNSQNSSNGAANYNNALKAQRYVDSRSTVRQGAFAKRRSSFPGNQFPATLRAANKAANAFPLRGRPMNARSMANTNQSRFPPVQNRAAHGGYSTKAQQQQRGEGMEKKQGNVGGLRGRRQQQQQQQRPHTLDSLFANMKEERMRSFSQQQQQRQRSDVRMNAVGLQQRLRVPWARDRRWGN